MHQFLSPEWIEAARRIRDEYSGRLPAPPLAVRMNLVVTEPPFGPGDIDAHIDTSSGDLTIDVGTLEEADLTVTVSYELTRTIFVERNQDAALEAFMAGRIRVEGDISKMLALQAQPFDPVAVEILRRVGEITSR